MQEITDAKLSKMDLAGKKYKTNKYQKFLGRYKMHVISLK